MAFHFPFKSIFPICLAISLILGSPMFSLAANMADNFEITWGNGRGRILNNGVIQLSLDKASGSGFKSKRQYMFARLDMRIKLVPGNSAGIVTTYYLSSLGKGHDEVDFEFLGNLSGSPYTLNTNLFSQGQGNREMQFNLWFDPSAGFHTYTIIWNLKNIVWFVDGNPIRQFRNRESVGVPFPKNKPMSLYCTIWNADDWATRGGTVKTDWSLAPFIATYANFNVDERRWLGFELNYASRRRMLVTQKNHMIYNYCTDKKRFPRGLPRECYA